MVDLEHEEDLLQAARAQVHIADAIGEEMTRQGLGEDETAHAGYRIVTALRHSGAVTPHFDPGRFDAAVRDAARKAGHARIEAGRWPEDELNARLDAMADRVSSYGVRETQPLQD